ncbi:MAG TPA: alpha/beta fold hydrolase [Planctomycetota bacterium]|nr:alpha/beta fold hydrolase [Planctomycetota bacterium]
MTRRHVLITLVTAFVAVSLGWREAAFAAATKAQVPDGPRETVLDRRVHTENKVLEIPYAPPLCDTLKLEKRRVNVGDCELYCELEGQGPALVVIHGGPGATHHCFHPHFSQAARFAKVVYYDQRGCGASGYVKGQGYTVEQAVEDLDKLRAALGFDKWVVLGHSYGGIVAQCYVVEHPERVAGLLLVGAATDALHLSLQPTRQYDCLSDAERKRISDIHRAQGLTLAQRVYNAHLNGDWKRQSFYRPTNEELARGALYEWKHDEAFRRSICRQLSGEIDLRGAFENCPIPVLLLEGQWDLTWNTDKPRKLQACFPGSRLVMFERSGHSPFGDEPERFFRAVEEFMAHPPKLDLARWKAHLAAWKASRENSPDRIVRTCGWGRKSSERLAARYAATWLNQLDPGLLLKTGFALYDVKRYEDALAVFRKMLEKADEDKPSQAVAMIWQGHVLDLLNRREEAVQCYRRAATAGQGAWSFDQYGLRIGSVAAYVEKRLQQPFARLENRGDD